MELFSRIDKILTKKDFIKHLKTVSRTIEWQNDLYTRIIEKKDALKYKAKQRDEDSIKKLVNIYKGEFREGFTLNDVAQDRNNFLVFDFISEINRQKLVNKNKALKWTKVLSEQGDKSAKLQLCEYYIDGIGGNANDGIVCYKNLYQEGYPSCAYSLAKIYHYGKGSVTKNLAEAAKWYKEASDEGFGHYKEAKYELALMHLEGKGVQQNQNKAIKLFKELYETDPSDYWGCGAGEMLESIKNNNSQEAETEQGDSFWRYLLIGLVIYFVIKTMYPY